MMWPVFCQFNLDSGAINASGTNRSHPGRRVVFQACFTCVSRVLNLFVFLFTVFSLRWRTNGTISGNAHFQENV